jgi:MFS family permease
VLGVAALTVVAQVPIPRLRWDRPAPAPRRHTPPAPPGTAGVAPAQPSLLLALVATGFLASCAVTCLPTFTATTGQHIGLAPWLIALAQTLGSVGSAVMRVVAPALTSRGSVRRQLVAVALLQGTGILGFLGLASGSGTGFVLGTVVAFTLGWGFNGLFNLIVTNAHPDRIATATGLTQGGVFLGGMTGPLVFAAIAGTEHLTSAWAAMALFMGTALGATLLAARRAGPSPAVHPAPVEAEPVRASETTSW